MSCARLADAAGKSSLRGILRWYKGEGSLSLFYERRIGMTTIDRYKPGGTGVMATADADGVVNTAIYAFPRGIDEHTVAWGMTARRTYQNLQANPNASFLYVEPGEGYRGFRLTLRVKEWVKSGPMLEEVRGHTRKVSSPAAAEAVQAVAFFTIIDQRPLV
jgi:Pyridoxamine 5'-phosphate oxidase